MSEGIIKKFKDWMTVEEEYEDEEYDDIEKIYSSIQCTSFYCEDCRNKQICDIAEDLMKSLKKFYRR